MPKIKALILDDEPAGRTVLSYFIQEFGSDLFGPVVTCSSIKETLETLESFDPDLIFVDIELQGESGLDLRKLAPSIPTVVVSAHSQYAIEALRLDVLDFLTKPLEVDQFNAFLTRIESKIQPKRPLDDSLIIRDGGNNVIILIQDILFIEASGAYSKIHTAERSYLASKTLKVLTPLLPDHFYRLHRSFLVPGFQIDSFKGNIANLKTGHQIGLSKSGRKLLIEKFGQ
jgi:two-component system LytT family response regulator